MGESSRCYCAKDAYSEDFKLLVDGREVDMEDCSNAVYPTNCPVMYHCPVEAGQGFHEVELASSVGCCPDKLEIRYPDSEPLACQLVLHPR